MGVLGYPRTGTASTLSENLGDHRRQRLAPDRRFFSPCHNKIMLGKWTQISRFCVALSARRQCLGL